MNRRLGEDVEVGLGLWYWVVDRGVGSPCADPLLEVGHHFPFGLALCSMSVGRPVGEERGTFGLEEVRLDLWIALEDVETDAGDFPRLHGTNECFFVDN